MPFWVHTLKCSDGFFYTGHTDNLEKRIAEHQLGLIPGYTHKRRPVEVIWSAELPTRIDALGRERQIKGWSRKKKEALVSGDWGRVRQLSKKRFRKT